MGKSKIVVKNNKWLREYYIFVVGDHKLFELLLKYDIDIDVHNYVLFEFAIKRKKIKYIKYMLDNG